MECESLPDVADPPGEGLDHEEFLAAAGELISAHEFADPSISATIRVRGGAQQGAELDSVLNA